MYKLFYVEDDAHSRSVMKMVERLDPENIKLDMLADSQDFESRLLALDTLPDLILLDIHVEPINGFAMLKLIRQHSCYDQVPVVALTASVMNEEVYQLRQSGFQGVLPKPIDLDTFPDLVKRIIAGENIWNVL